MRVRLRSRIGLAILCAAAVLVSAGCGGPKSLIVVMPDPDGKVGTVEVVNQQGTVVLDRPWQATEVASLDKTPGAPRVLDEQQVKDRFREAIAARPEPPVTYRIHFKSGGVELTAESHRTLREVLKAIEVRNPHEIGISGHTDTVGSVEFNRALSLKRAREIASTLVSRGVKKELLEITYHGKENPLIRTPDGVAEPMNRRVEITIR